MKKDAATVNGAAKEEVAEMAEDEGFDPLRVEEHQEEGSHSQVDKLTTTVNDEFTTNGRSSNGHGIQVGAADE